MLLDCNFTQCFHVFLNSWFHPVYVSTVFQSYLSVRTSVYRLPMMLFPHQFSTHHSTVSSNPPSACYMQRICKDTSVTCCNDQTDRSYSTKTNLRVFTTSEDRGSNLIIADPALKRFAHVSQWSKSNSLILQIDQLEV